MRSTPSRARWLLAGVVVLFPILFAELFFSVRQNSQTFDESAHIYAGYSYWTRGDFGINPEHPPVAKMLAAIPLLPLHLNAPPGAPIYSRAASAFGGQIFLYTHNADQMLLRARLAMSIFTFALALLILLGAREMFGGVAALIALLLFVFNPNVVANGALVTTDMALSATLFAAVYTFYRYTRRPTPTRLLLCALACGLTLSVKHSGLIVFPLLVLLSIGTLLLPRAASDPSPDSTRRRQALRLGVALVIIGAISYLMLWSAYGFRYAARPGNAPLTPPTTAFLTTLHRPLQARMIGFAEQHHLLPEAYLYGLTDVAVLTSQGRPTYLFGKLYPTGQWFYFPATFLIKNTLGFLLLLALALTTAHLWRKDRARELLFLLLPAGLYFAVALFSHLNIGHRHILPIYPFLTVFIAAGAGVLVARSRVWAGVVIVLLAIHVVSSLRAFPAYLPYSNEAWGGPSNTWKVLSDSNVGWASDVKPLQRYIQQHGIQRCWLAYDGPAVLSYFHLPCKRLPTIFSTLFRSPQTAVPARIDGPIFIATEAVTGFGWGPAGINPYAPFLGVKPDDEIQGEILVYNRSFNVPRVAALSHLSLARQAAASGHSDVALREAQQAEALAPELIQSHEALSAFYAANHQPAEASREYATALGMYNTVYSAWTLFVSPPVDPSAPPQRGS
ncbi:MAG TPA: phospholipid carrier-dependent glycosyltransferase [Acidobacteriaceae bacterium]|nr:phospholipid carrier-dependent glycosyltransferase [Acidobacteriaceae bacterium]